MLITTGFTGLSINITRRNLMLITTGFTGLSINITRRNLMLITTGFTGLWASVCRLMITEPCVGKEVVELKR